MQARYSGHAVDLAPSPAATTVESWQIVISAGLEAPAIPSTPLRSTQDASEGATPNVPAIGLDIDGILELTGGCGWTWGTGTRAR